ncbi:avidin/streptavidin family protein [Trinickia fusca]|uniref:Avidin n=1 Tax=Trinickia fusca TaxID=2419777 RepID=A0A494XRF9_9BURK|nr:avidin/streptavidin family protein [Trinickia fusca]RKP52231.1 avidin [Trinickia fusca]
MAVDRKKLKPFSLQLKSEQAATSSLEGTWTNELGSTMLITQTSGSTFGGTYKSAVSSGGQSVKGTLAGTIAGDALAFTVNWQPTYSSVTSWNGLLLSDPQGDLYIYSLWNMSSTPQDPSNFWESILAGADLFEQS